VKEDGVGVAEQAGAAIVSLVARGAGETRGMMAEMSLNMAC